MYRVVIADDERIIRSGLQVVVDWNGLGFEIVGCAGNGEEALQMLLEHDAHVLLTDIRMPGLSGLQLVQKVHELGLQIDIILLTSYLDLEYARQAVSLGVREYLLKPVDEVALAELLKKIRDERDRQDSSDGARREQQLVSQLRKMIEEEYMNNISLKSLAERLHYNPAYLGRLFRAETGNSFRDELNAYRVRQAAQLLRSSDISIYEVVERVGYHDINYFHRIFLKTYGMSPGKYKSGQRKG